MFQVFYYTIDCLVITIYYSLGGLVMSYFMEKFFVDVNYHKYDTEIRNIVLLTLDILLSIFVINLFALILRLCIDYIPFPFSKRLKKRTTFLIDGGIVLSVSILLFQKKFAQKCKLLSKIYHIHLNRII